MLMQDVLLTDVSNYQETISQWNGERLFTTEFSEGDCKHVTRASGYFQSKNVFGLPLSTIRGK